MGQINKGTIAVISRNTARVVPYDTSTSPTATVLIPQHLRGEAGNLKKGTEVVYIEFEDYTGLLLSRADGEGGSGGGGGTVQIDLDTTLTKEGMAAEAKAVGTRFETLEGKLEDVLYEAITITAFSNDVNTAELGSAINTVALAWALSKTPETLTLDGVALDVGSEGITLSGLGLRSGKTWTLVATDERGASASRSTSVSFLNGVYYGVLSEGAAIDSAAVLKLTRKLQSGKTITFTVTAGAAQRIAFALPSRYGTPVFSVGGFEGGFELAATFDFENGSGYTETYNVWLSSRTGLGTTTVSVK